MSTLQRCLYYTQTTLIQITKETEPSVHITEVSVLQSNLFNMDTKGTEPNVHITEVSILHSNHLNTDNQRDRAKCQHYRGVCVTVKSP